MSNYVLVIKVIITNIFYFSMEDWDSVSFTQLFISLTLLYRTRHLRIHTMTEGTPHYANHRSYMNPSLMALKSS